MLHLASMPRGALFGLMTCGMATIAGTVMVLYASITGPVIPGALGYILTASLLSAPVALMVAAILVPHAAQEAASERLELKHAYGGAMDAITRGTLDAIPLFLNIIALLLVVLLSTRAHELSPRLPQNTHQMDSTREETGSWPRQETRNRHPWR